MKNINKPLVKCICIKFTMIHLQSKYEISIYETNRSQYNTEKPAIVYATHKTKYVAIDFFHKSCKCFTIWKAVNWKLYSGFMQIFNKR